MAIEKTELDCGCTITVYGDRSALPDLVRCSLHSHAEELRDTLLAMERCPGIDHTDQESGETFRTMIRASVASADGEPEPPSDTLHPEGL